MFHTVVINNYGAANAAFGNTNSTPNGAPNGHRSHFATPNSPGPTIELYNSSQDSVPSYVQATSPQPASAFPPIAVSRVSFSHFNNEAKHYQDRNLSSGMFNVNLIILTHCP